MIGIATYRFSAGIACFTLVCTNLALWPLPACCSSLAASRLAMFVSDEGFAVEFRFEGTHIGDFYGIPATGRTVSFPFVGTYKVEGSEIVTGTIYLPMDRIKSALS